MRLIDADAVIGILYRLTPFNSKGIQLFNSIEERINALPTIEIVRCKECKYWQPHTQCGYDDENGVYNDYCGLLTPEDDFYAISMNADDFCSCGKRREP